MNRLNPPLVKDDFSSLSENKVEFVRRICEDKELAKCLLCNSSSFKEFELPEDYVDQLVWQHVFPFRYVVDTQETQKSYITTAFEYESSDTPNVWKIGTVKFYLFCHKDIVKTDYGVLRYDYMLSRISMIMNNARFKTWFNRLEFVDMGDIIVDEIGNFVGIEVVYTNRGVA